MNSVVDISNVVLKTERLIIRPWKLSDLNDFYDYCKVDGVGQWAGWYPHKNKEESLVILNSFINNNFIYIFFHNTPLDKFYIWI